MIYQLYKKIGFSDNIAQINYGSDGSICEVDGNQTEIWKQLPSGKWIKLHPDLVPGEVVHRKQGRKMLMEPAPEPAPEVPLLASLLYNQESYDQDSSKQNVISSSSLHQHRQKPLQKSFPKPYQSQHRYEKQHNQNPSQLYLRQPKRDHQWDEWQGQ
jgi:hypothetical protein